MPAKRRKRTNRSSAPLFAVSNDPLELIEWPEDDAEAAALVAECHRIRDLMQAMKATGQDRRNDATTMQMLTAVSEYLRVHPDGHRLHIDGGNVYSDDFRRFVLALARGPGAGMTPLELSFATGVPLDVLEPWRRDADRELE